jgi:hypothetical protein
MPADGGLARQLVSRLAAIDGRGGPADLVAGWFSSLGARHALTVTSDVLRFQMFNNDSCCRWPRERGVSG